MYDLTIVYKDFKTHTVEVEEAEIDKLIASIKSNESYFDNSKKVGFWLPLDNLRCLYVKKKITQLQEEPCQENQSLDQALDSQN